MSEPSEGPSCGEWACVFCYALNLVAGVWWVLFAILVGRGGSVGIGLAIPLFAGATVHLVAAIGLQGHPDDARVCARLHIFGITDAEPLPSRGARERHRPRVAQPLAGGRIPLRRHVVREGRFELPRVAPQDPKSCASANSATRAGVATQA